MPGAGLGRVGVLEHLAGQGRVHDQDTGELFQGGVLITGELQDLERDSRGRRQPIGSEDQIKWGRGRGCHVGYSKEE